MKGSYKKVLELSYSLAKANFKVRNEGSYLGILWYLLNPLSFFLIILYIRGALFLTTTVAYYPLYLIIGLTMLNFFNQAVGGSVNLIRSNANFIKSIKIPYEVFILAGIFQAVFSHAFELLLIAAMLVYFHVSLVGVFGYIVIFFLYAVFTLGLSFLSATIGLYFSDFGNIWAIATQMLLFVTPVFYVAVAGSLLYEGNLFNPLFYFLTGARDVLIDHALPSLWMSLVMVGLSLGSVAIGLAVFQKLKGRFAEFI